MDKPTHAVLLKYVSDFLSLNPDLVSASKDNLKEPFPSFPVIRISPISETFLNSPIVRTITSLLPSGKGPAGVL